MLNQLLVLLETTQQYARFPEWLATFEHACTALRDTPLSPTQEQRVRAAEGTCALLRASYLAATVSPLGGSMASTTAQQLACVEQAIALGPPLTQQRALHRQAEMFVRLYRYDAAATTYQNLVQQWPDDQRARQRLDLLTVVQLPSPDPASTDRIIEEALTAACTSASAPPMPAPLTPGSALAWLQQAPRHAPNVLDVLDILTAYGGVAVQRQEWQRAIAVLTPLYTLSAQPRQAYYLAVAHYARSQQLAPGMEALHASEQALQYAQDALKDAPSLTAAAALLREMAEHHQTLLTMRSQEQDRMAYRRHVCSFFAQHSIPVQEHTVPGGPDAAWVEIQELADLDEATGKLVTTVHLSFNGQAVGARVVPDEAEVTLYAQHQRDKQRLVETYGIEALPWPHTAYEGSTDFAALFPERLGLNRDVLFIAFADLHALLRYARVLQYIAQGLPTSAAATPPPSVNTLAAAARYLTLLPLLHQRLQILAAAAPSKVVQRQIISVCETLPTGHTSEPLQPFPAFVDAYIYFHAIVDAMRAQLDTPPAERAGVQSEERQPPRPARRKRRQNKDRWREGEPERRREGHFSDVL
jgi:tetratricopeptide (TPR) repeat protein